MPVRVLKVHTATAVMLVDLTRSALTWVGPVLKVLLADPGEDLIEFGFGDQKGIVLRGNLAVGLVEVKTDAVVHLDHLERAEAGGSGQPENLGEKSRGCLLVTCHHDSVIELHSHGVLLYL
jgi:hypothetical protein